MTLIYAKARLAEGSSNDPALVRRLQTDLRALGYLARGIDGIFGPHTGLAVRRLQHDLLHNDGRSAANDGPAPVAMTDYNVGHITDETGVVDARLADCIEALVLDEAVPKLPRSGDGAAANAAALAAAAAAPSRLAPTPFVVAMARQESGARHFREPSGRDEDDFLRLSLAGDPAAPSRVTARGYGLGHYVIHHHPPRPEELRDVIANPVNNLQRIRDGLRDAFEGGLVGGRPESAAPDRLAEHPLLPLRACRYRPGDPRYLTDCGACARQAMRRDIRPGTPLHRGAEATYGAMPDAAYGYPGVPDRACFPCDWPYAARRYRGTGVDSYHYQARLLIDLRDGPAEPAPAARGRAG
jgi:hypothetical protein